jgi:hypothetical protein
MAGSDLLGNFRVDILRRPEFRDDLVMAGGSVLVRSFCGLTDQRCMAERGFRGGMGVRA